MNAATCPTDHAGVIEQANASVWSVATWTLAWDHVHAHWPEHQRDAVWGSIVFMSAIAQPFTIAEALLAAAVANP